MMWAVCVQCLHDVYVCGVCDVYVWAVCVCGVIWRHVCCGHYVWCVCGVCGVVCVCERGEASSKLGLLSLGQLLSPLDRGPYRTHRLIGSL